MLTFLAHQRGSLPTSLAFLCVIGPVIDGNGMAVLVMVERRHDDETDATTKNSKARLTFLP
jgi:hypothetical protein